MTKFVSAKAMRFALATFGVAIVPLPAIAQTTDISAPATASAHYSTAETTIGTLLENPAAKAIVDKHIPGLSSNASISMASGMTLRAIQPMAGDKISAQMLDAVDADLAKLPTK